MAKLIIFLVSAFTVTAFGSSSCPMLAGKYPTCKTVKTIDPEVSLTISDLNILQANSTYTINLTIDGEPSSETVIADGVERDINRMDPETGKMEVVKVTVNCNKNSLSVLS